MKNNTKSAFSLILSLSLLTSSALTLPVNADSTEYVQSDEIITGSDFDGFEFSLPEMPEILANYKEEAHNYGYYLDTNNIEVYKAFMQLINPSVEPITVKLPEPVTFELSSKMNEQDVETLKEAVFSSSWPAIMSATFDIPELFWLDTAKISISYDYSRNLNFFTGKYSCKLNAITFTPGYYDSFESIDDVLEYKSKLDEAVENYKLEGETRYEMLKSLHDKISLFTYYDVNAPFSASVIGGLVEAGSVCESYSKSFKLICDKLNIPCINVFGNLNSETQTAHMWNYVKMEDDNWYAVDVTWDDRDGENGIEVAYSYFLKGSDSFFKNHTPEDNYHEAPLNYPEISKKDYDPNKAVTTTQTTVTITQTTTTTTSAASTTITTTTAPKTEKTTSETTVTAKTETTAKPTATTVTTTVSSALSTTSSANVTTTSSETVTTTTSTKKRPSKTTESTTSTTSVSAVTETTTALKPDVYGDVNGDGICNIADLVYCSNTVIGSKSQEKSCDVNKDGFEDVFDVVIIRKILV